MGSTGLGYDIKELYLTTTSPNGCIYQHGIAVLFDFGSCFGTDEHSVEPVRVFPNPGQGTFSFESTSNEKWRELKIYNVQQQLVYFEQLTVDNGPGNRIIKDLSFLPAGIYFVNLSREGARGCGKLVILP